MIRIVALLCANILANRRLSHFPPYFSFLNDPVLSVEDINMIANLFFSGADYLDSNRAVFSVMSYLFVFSLSEYEFKSVG